MEPWKRLRSLRRGSPSGGLGWQLGGISERTSDSTDHISALTRTKHKEGTPVLAHALEGGRRCEGRGQM